MVGPERNLDTGNEGPRRRSEPHNQSRDTTSSGNDEYFQAISKLPNELPASFAGARNTKITARGGQGAGPEDPIALASRTEAREAHPVPELEPFGQKFARDLSKRISERGINSLGDIIKQHTEALKLPGEKPWEVIHSAVPTIAEQLQRDFEGKIEVSEADGGGIVFTEKDSKNYKANEIKYYSSGSKFYEEKFRPDGSSAEWRVFNYLPSGNRETPEWVEQYFPPPSGRTPRALNDKETQSRTDYFEDGKTKSMECIYGSTASYEATTTIYNRDGSKFAEINRDIHMAPGWRRALPNGEKENEPFSLKLYGSNNTSITLDADGLREMDRKFKATGKAPAGIATDKLKEHLKSFVDTLPIEKTVGAAEKLVKAISDQIEKGGIGSLEKVIKEHGAKLISMADTIGSDITHAGVTSAIAREVESRFEDIKVSKTEDGYEFRQLDPKTKTIRSVSYFADGPKSREALLDEHNKVMSEKLFIPR